MKLIGDKGALADQPLFSEQIDQNVIKARDPTTIRNDFDERIYGSLGRSVAKFCQQFLWQIGEIVVMRRRANRPIGERDRRLLRQRKPFKKPQQLLVFNDKPLIKCDLFRPISRVIRCKARDLILEPIDLALDESDVLFHISQALRGTRRSAESG